MKRAAMLAGSIVALASSTAWAGPPGLAGTWEGFLNPSPAAEVRLILRVDAGPDGSLKAKAESPDAPGLGSTSFDDVSMKDGAAVLVDRSSGREFRGRLNPEGTEMAGEWKRGAVALPLTFARVEGALAPSEIWEGSLEVPGGIKLRLVFHVSRAKGRPPRATMDSPDQGAFGFKVDSAEIDKDVMRFAVKSIGGEFDGKLDPAGESAAGPWKQGGASFPMTLRKVAKVSEARRPQVPKGPFPYASEEVAYDSRARGVRIAGTLTRPEGDGPFPAVLLISGSGPQDRDETILGHKPFLVLADDLTRRGVAVLRVDDRGVGGSTGNHASATSADFAEDVLGGLDFLKAQAGIDPKRIGLIGHSEGGLIGPMVAARSVDVAFLVLMAGPGLPGDQILAAQLALILKASGVDEAAIRRSTESQARLMAVAKAANDPAEAREKFKAIGAEMARALPEAEGKALAASDPNGALVGQLATPWFRYFLAFDPRPTLSQVRCPVLAVNGEKDLQVPPGENLRAVEQALRAGGNPAVTVLELPGLNHLFQACTTGAPSEYATIEETINPAALKAIGDWVAARTRSN